VYILDTKGNVGIGTHLQSAKLEVNGDARIIDKPLWLRRDGDQFHGIGWYDSFANSHINGPVVFGGDGGALASTGNGKKI